MSSWYRVEAIANRKKSLHHKISLFIKSWILLSSVNKGRHVTDTTKK